MGRVGGHDCCGNVLGFRGVGSGKWRSVSEHRLIHSIRLSFGDGLETTNLDGCRNSTFWRAHDVVEGLGRLAGGDCCSGALPHRVVDGAESAVVELSGSNVSFLKITFIPVMRAAANGTCHAWTLVAGDTLQVACCAFVSDVSALITLGTGFDTVREGGDVDCGEFTAEAIDAAFSAIQIAIDGSDCGRLGPPYFLVEANATGDSWTAISGLILQIARSALVGEVEASFTLGTGLDTVLERGNVECGELATPTVDVAFCTISVAIDCSIVGGLISTRAIVLRSRLSERGKPAQGEEESRRLHCRDSVQY